MFKARQRRSGSIAAKVGSGGCPSSGSSFGFGFTLPISCGNLEAPRMPTAGGHRPSVVVSPGELEFFIRSQEYYQITDLTRLPASPLWLTGLYAPQMAPVNAYVMPPTWFAFSIFLMEVVTIGFPIFQIFKTHALRQETLDAIASWEKRQNLDDCSDSTIVGLDALHKSSSLNLKSFSSGEVTPVTPASSNRKSSLDSHKSDMFTMAAFENALKTNPVPLLQFAALKDFSGENVSFLTYIADWRREWLSPKTSVMEHRRKQFVAATRIYAHFVSLEHSEFPINISSKEMKVLHNVFEDAATLLIRDGSVTSSTDSATPFDNVQLAENNSNNDLRSGVNLDSLGWANLRSVLRMIELRHEEVLANVEIPGSFSETVFDPAESEIKYLVLTNTWPKFVNTGYETRQQDVEMAMERPRARWVGKAILCGK